MQEKSCVLTINGQSVEAAPGMTILEACRRAGIEVPTLCFFECLTPVGACRMCTVEVEGARTNPSACTTPAADGMVVRTNTEDLKEERRKIIELLYAERNHFCPVCPMNGQCELQALAYSHEIESIRYHYVFPNIPADMTHRDFGLDQNRCVLCTRCVRVCRELVGAGTLAVSERGRDSIIIADVGVPLAQSSCLDDGNCVQICPTGSLFDKRSVFRVRPDVLRNATPTICPECSVGCRMNVHASGNLLLRFDGDFEASVSRGLLCRKGRYDLIDRPTSPATTPKVKKDGAWVEVTWDKAIRAAAEGLKTVAAESGPDRLAGIISPNATTETYRAFAELLAEGARTDRLDTIGGEEWRVWTATTQRAEEVGYPMPVVPSLDTIDTADLIVVFGADPMTSHPVLGMMALRAAANKKAALYVVHSSPTELARAAEMEWTLSDRAQMELLEGIVFAAAREDRLTPIDVRRIVGRDADGDGLRDEATLALMHAIFTDDIRVVWITDLTRETGRRLLPMLVGIATAAAGETPAEIVPLMSGNNLLGAVESGCVAEATLEGPIDGAIVSVAEWRNIGDDWIERLAEARFVVLHGEGSEALLDVADVWLPALAWAYQDGTRTNFNGIAQTVTSVLASDASPTDEAIFARLAAALRD